MQYDLPAHIAYTQQLPSDIKYNLSNSSAAISTIEQVAPNAIEQIGSLPLSYASIRGDEVLRKQIVEFVAELNPDSPNNEVLQCITYCGAQEAIQAIYHSLLLPGDEVVLVNPCYPSLYNSALYLGAKVTAVKPEFDGEWRCPVEQIIACLSQQTKLIVVNSPHNPTGCVYTEDQHRALLEAAERIGCYILSDDVSQASNFNKLSIGHSYLHYEKAISIGVLSKSFGLPGVRLGWSVTVNRELNEKLLAYKCANSICTSRIDEVIAIEVLSNRTSILSKNNCVLLNNMSLFDQFVSTSAALEWTAPKAGILTLVKYNGKTPFQQWLQKLITHYSTVVLPSSLFGYDGPFFRLGLGQENFSSALKVLSTSFDS